MKNEDISASKEFAFTLTASISAYAILSTILDEVYFKIDRGDAPGNIFLSVLHYLVYGVTIGFFGWILISLLYTTFYLKFKIVTSRTIWRLLYATAFGALIGFLLQDSQGSYYIGNMRPQRNKILFPLIGLVVEATRLIFFRRHRVEKTS